MRPSPEASLRRRDVLRGAGALGITMVPIWTQACAQPSASSARGLISGSTCPVTPRQTEGPFYFDPRLTRADIAEDRSGVPLRLRLQVVEAKGCAPATGARVDIWHCDADGVYSGYAREGATDAAWLRGTQLADAEGIVAFETIYPGWYSGRAVHIHCKAWLTDGREITSQLYFPDELTDQIHARAPYAQRGQRGRRNDDDGIFRRAGGAAMLDMRGDPDGYVGSVVIALS